MYICVGTLRINSNLIRYYNLDVNETYLIISVTEADGIYIANEDYDLDILILELDRVCNPKVLKGKLDEK